jgi:lipopolysaccharide export system protein LptC
MRSALPERSLRAENRPSAIVATVSEWPLVGEVFGGWAGSANRHSRRVALLKRVLPAIGVVLLLLIAIWPRLAPLWQRMRLAFPAIDLREARELTITNPRYAGIDRLGRPFVITAASGRQLADRQDLMSLQLPNGELKMRGGADLVVTGKTGVYQSQTQLLDLFDDVTLVHQNGTRFLTQAARVNAANNTAEGSDQVTGHGPSGDVVAQGFRILDKGDTIVFTGRSALWLKSAKPSTGPTAQPAALPPPVKADAARAENEAAPLLRAAHPATPAATTRRAPTRRPGAPERRRPIGKSHADVKPSSANR